MHRQFQHARPNKQREFFDVPIPEAINAIRELGTVKFERLFYRFPEEIEQHRLVAERQAQERDAAQVLERRNREAESAYEAAMSDWLEKSNAPILAARVAFIESKTSFYKSLVMMTAGAAAVMSFMYLGSGGAVVVSFLAALAFFSLTNEADENARKDAEARFLIKSPDDFLIHYRQARNAEPPTAIGDIRAPVGKLSTAVGLVTPSSKNRGSSFIICPGCKLRYDYGGYGLFKAECPSCRHRWTVNIF